MSNQKEINRAAPLMDRVNEAIRDNPLAAGLIGAGVAWMVLGSRGLGAIGGLAKNAGGAVASAAADVGSAGANAGRAALRTGAAAVASVKDAAADLSNAAASSGPDDENPGPSSIGTSVADASKAIGERLQGVASSGREYGAVIQSRLSDSLQQQPLLLGAIGLAIGAGIASTFATTQIEGEWMGEKGTAARDTLSGVAGDVKERAGQVLSDIQSEATRQGLTPETAREAATSVAGKLRGVADAVKKPRRPGLKGSRPV